MKENLSENYCLIEKIKIKRSDDWKNSIDIYIELMNQTLEYDPNVAIDLFIIIKSYSKNIKYIPKSINTRVLKSALEKNIVTFKENTRFFEKMNFEEYLEWWNYRINNDNRYIAQESMYSITLIYSEKIIDLNNEMIYPIYPWNEKILLELKTLENKENYYTKIIEQKNEEIKKKNELIKIKDDEIKKLKKNNYLSIIKNIFRK